MIFFLPEVSKQLWRQSSKYLHSYNILLLAKYFYSRTKCAFVLGGLFLRRCTWGGNRSHGPGWPFISLGTPTGMKICLPLGELTF